MTPYTSNSKILEAYQKVLNEHFASKDSQWWLGKSEYATLRDKPDSETIAKDVALGFTNIIKTFLNNGKNELQKNGISVCIELDGEPYPFDNKINNKGKAYKFVWSCLDDSSYTYLDLDAMETSPYVDSQIGYDEPSEEFTDIIDTFAKQVKNRVQIRNRMEWILPGEYHASIKTSTGVLTFTLNFARKVNMGYAFLSLERPYNGETRADFVKRRGELRKPNLHEAKSVKEDDYLGESAEDVSYLEKNFDKMEGLRKELVDIFHRDSGIVLGSSTLRERLRDACNQILGVLDAY